MQHAALGVTVIVTDHHPPYGPLPSCAAPLNPRRTDNCYPDKDLCGVGMAYGLLRALAQDRAHLDLDAGLDQVALGTIADVVPLRGENRVLVRRGLPLLSRAAQPGPRALLEVSGVSRLVLAPRDIAFRLAPRLNAAGRLGDAAALDTVNRTGRSSRGRLRRRQSHRSRLAADWGPCEPVKR